MRVVVVSAEWDDEAKVWVAEAANLPGLITEAATLERLRERLALIVPDLLDEYGESESEVTIDLITVADGQLHWGDHGISHAS